MLTIKDHIAGNVEFQYYRAGNLMYKTSTDLEFAVPVSDTNDATFPSRGPIKRKLWSSELVP